MRSSTKFVVLIAILTGAAMHFAHSGVSFLDRSSSRQATAQSADPAPETAGPTADEGSKFLGIFPVAHARSKPATATPPAAGAHVTVGFSPGNAESIVVHTINSARESIRVAAYSFTSRPIATALLSAVDRGVDVRVVADKSQRTAKYTSVRFLANKGVPVRLDNRYAIMHNKFIVVDGKTVQTGSFNYTRSAHIRNAENVIVLADQPAVAKAYSKEWNRLWAESTPTTAGE